MAAWLAHVGVLVPCLGFMSKPFQPGDRYLIVSGAILAALVGGVLARKVPARVESMRQMIASVIMLALGVVSYAYAPVWADNATNFTAQADTLPDGQRRTMALLRLGRVQFERGDVVGALASYAAAEASDPEYPDVELPWNHGVALEAAGQLPEAIARYESSLRMNVNLEEAWHRLGALLFRTGKRPQGEAIFQQGLLIHEGSVAMIVAYANALVEAGDMPAALSMLQFQERLQPENPAIRAMREQAEAAIAASRPPR